MIAGAWGVIEEWLMRHRGARPAALPLAVLQPLLSHAVRVDCARVGPACASGWLDQADALQQLSPQRRSCEMAGIDHTCIMRMRRHLTRS